MPFEVRQERNGDVTNCVVTGELDVENVYILRECVDEVLRAEPRELVLDLSAVTFIDSSGLATLIDTSRRAQQTGVDLGVNPGSGKVRQVLELTQLDRRLRIVG